MPAVRDCSQAKRKPTIAIAMLGSCPFGYDGRYTARDLSLLMG
jgi:hypothetical protein